MDNVTLNNEVLEKLAAGWRSQLSLEGCFLIMGNVQDLPNSWSMVDCTFTTLEAADRAFKKRVANTSKGTLALIDPSNSVVELVTV